MAVLGSDGKSAAAGPPVLYQMMSGQILFSEEVTERGDSFYFNGEKTCLLTVGPVGEKGNVNIQIGKFSLIGFRARSVRVLKTAVVMVTDVGQEDLVTRCRSAIHGLVLPAGPVN